MPLPQPSETELYGARAKSVIETIQTDLPALAHDIIERFYASLADQGAATVALHRLLPEEFEHLKRQQTQYLITLMSTELTHAAHQHEASKIGQAHILAGIDILWIVGAYRFFQDEIYKLLKPRIADSGTHDALIHILSQRFLLDIENQLACNKQIAGDVTKAFALIDHVAMSTENLAELIRGALEIIGNLPGGVSAFFARVDEFGALQIEQSYGEAAEAYHRAMETDAAPKISIDPTLPAGNGPGGRAWRSGKITVSDAWLIESDKMPWRKVGAELGFRSSAAVPLRDDSGRTIALLSLYSSWLGYFSIENIHGFLTHLQQVLGHGVQQRMHAPVVPMREQQAYRALLDERRLVMHYQPVLNLRDGSLVKIEGLARLYDGNGNFISPQRFLPALGHDELLTLFELGLERVCADLLVLQSHGIETKAAINLPAEGLDDPRYERAIFSKIEKSGLPPGRLQLELLETEDAGERTSLHKAFIQRMQAAGMQISQDDLGSGHSSLLRLDQYPFDEVKIDQGLVRGALQNPKRAVEFILYLTRLAHAFNTRVTVEGLENEGMIEAAAILGADHGQGYGIAKPMPVERLKSWCRDYRYTVNPSAPKTAIGAMAGYMLWDIQLATISERPELAGDFVGARAIVEQFIKANKLRESPIDQLLTRSHEVLSTQDGQSDAAEIRAQLLQELTDYWFNELNS